MRLICALWLFWVTLPAFVHAATLIDNVHGYTLDQLGRLIQFPAMLVGDDGRVIATGNSESLQQRKPNADRIDGQGATLLPGLIDAHGHIMGLGFQILSLDLSTTKSLEEAQERLRIYAAEHPDLPWILGRGWNQVAWGLDSFPTAHDLDVIVPDRPVWLVRVDGHAGWANSKAVQFANINSETPDPSGGVIVRKKDGAPLGVFVDGAMPLIKGSIPMPSQAAREQALIAALEALAKVGVTSVHDAGIDAETWALYKDFAQSGRLTTRIYAMIGGVGANFDTLSNEGIVDGAYQDRLSLRSVKLYADGALGSRGAALLAPYSDDDGNMGLLFWKDAQLKNTMAKIIGAGYQVSIHAIGDRANRQVLDSFSSILPYMGKELRHRIEHAQVVAEEDFSRFANMGIIASVQPIHAPSDRAMAPNRLGNDRLPSAYAWRKFLGTGARIAAGSDFPVESPNPFWGLFAAITRQAHENEPSGGWMPEQALTRREAFRAFTLDAAYAGFQEKKIGSLEPGKWGDFILVDQDIFTVNASQIWKTKVLETWLAGKRVYCSEDRCDSHMSQSE